MAYPTAPAPNHIEEVKREFLVDEVKTEDGSVFTRIKNTSKRRTWRLEYQQLSESDQSTMNAWYDARYGAYQSDTWSHPYLGTSGTIRCRGWVWIMGAYRRQTLTVTLEEVI